jgi:uncharacterized membrane protein
MMERSFHYIWVAIMALLVVLMAIPLWMFARPALFGFPGASGDPTGIGTARFGAGLVAVLFSLIEILFVIMLVRGVRRVRRNGKAQRAGSTERRDRDSVENRTPLPRRW